MKQEAFILAKQDAWTQFEEALTKHMQPDEDEDDESKVAEPHDLPKLYRQISHDLANAKARQYSPELIQRLNDLLLLGQSQLYRPSNRVLSSLIRFVSNDFRQSLCSIKAYIIWAHILFYGFAFSSAALVIYSPDALKHFVDPGTISSIERMYNPSSEHFAKERASDSDFLMFGHYIRNNISIAFQCFAGGLAFGIGALFYLLYNAIFFGAISAHIVNIDYGSTFFSFVITHGSFELTAIVISAAAGGVIGKHLIAPGQRSRIDSLKLAGKRTFPVILGCFILLVLAAFVEAFWSSSQSIPNEAKYIVGGLCWLWILAFVFWPTAQSSKIESPSEQLAHAAR
ncbi:stage II sporulation protein M [Ningiella sp. W23]|uniref:stage II sporulation protein M n=1 Tax=Ningiella sp. W23 TaxID=3023715 RepID=UPI003757CDA2